MSAEPFIPVDRKKKLGWLARFHLPMAVAAGWIAGRRLFRNLRRRRAKGEGDAPSRDPLHVELTAARGRGMPVLVADAGAAGELIPRCVACGLCERVCPPKCIHVIPVENGGARGEGEPAIFDLDMSRCMLCGLCEEVCPEEAIVMSSHQRLAAFEREALRFHMRELMVPAEYVERGSS